MSTATPMQPPEERPSKPLSDAEVQEVKLANGRTIRIDGQGRLLCKARRRDGELCHSPVVSGLPVCRMHGASAPQARLAARQSLADLVDPAIRKLGGILNSSGFDPDDPGSRPKDADVLRAATIVLDRTGFGPSATIDVVDAKGLLYQRLLAGASDSDEVRSPAEQNDPMWNDEDDGPAD